MYIKEVICESEFLFMTLHPILVLIELSSLIKSQKFFNNSQEEVTVLEEMLKKMSNLFQDLLEFFVLDPKKNSSEEFFGNLHSFMLEYDVSMT